LHSAILKVDDASFIAHDVSVGPSDNSDPRRVAQLTPGEGCQSWGGVDSNSLPTVIGDGIAFNFCLGKQSVMALLTRGCPTDAAVNINVVA